jgi:hypothetical protein
MMPLAAELDVRAVLPTIRVPTLVVHHTDDPIILPDRGKDIAAPIPGAKYVEVPGVGGICPRWCTGPGRPRYWRWRGTRGPTSPAAMAGGTRTIGTAWGSSGINVFGPLNHGMCQSIYFAGPEHLLPEIATSAAAIDDRAWIDPEVVALCGIDDDELAAMRSPADYQDEGGRVPNPPIDWSKPHQVMADEAEYVKLMTAPDEEVTRKMSVPDPPVRIEELQTTR